MSTERRCPACAALVAADADWCGQCFTPLRDGEAAATAERGSPAADVPITVAAPGGQQGGGGAGPEAPRSPPVAATWTCPMCGEVNDLAANACTVCGTPFARLFEPPSKAPSISPAAAAISSLVFPGVGHWRLGRTGDAVARAVLGVWILGTLIILLGTSGQGSLGLVALIALYGLATIALWLLTAVDAARAAAGFPPLVPSRMLLWGSVALVVLSMILATVIALPALNRPPGVPSG